MTFLLITPILKISVIDAVIAPEHDFSETSHGGRCLILDGYCFRKKNSTDNTSYWFCCKLKCPARGILRSNGRFQLTKSSHNHKPDYDSIKKQESLQQIKKLALQVNTPGRELLESLGIKENIKKHLSFIRTCRSRGKKRNPVLSTSSTQTQAGLNYKRLMSPRSSRDMLLHHGFVFRQDSVNRNKQNCRYWRCKIKGCRARAKTDESGNLTLLNKDHSHSPQETTIGQTVQTELSTDETLAPTTLTF